LAGLFVVTVQGGMAYRGLLVGSSNASEQEGKWAVGNRSVAEKWGKEVDFFGKEILMGRSQTESNSWNVY
jgi:hypothetical protein